MRKLNFYSKIKLILNIFQRVRPTSKIPYAQPNSNMNTRKKSSLELEGAGNEEWDILVDEGFISKKQKKLILS